MSFLKMICMTLTFKPMTLKTNYFMALLQQIVVYFWKSLYWLGSYHVNCQIFGLSLVDFDLWTNSLLNVIGSSVLARD